MKTCGNCYYHRFGKCKNKNASTYGVSYPGYSEGCQMHMPKFLLPLGGLAAGLAFIVSIPIAIMSELNSHDTPSNDSGSGGFEI